MLASMSSLRNGTSEETFDFFVESFVNTIINILVPLEMFGTLKVCLSSIFFLRELYTGKVRVDWRSGTFLGTRPCLYFCAPYNAYGRIVHGFLPENFVTLWE